MNTFHRLFCVNQSEHATNRKPLFQQTFCLKHAIQSLSVREQAQMDVLSLSRDTACRGRCNTHTHRVLTSICKKNYSAKNFFSPPRNVFVFYSVSREEIQLQKKKNYFMTFLFHVWNRVGEKKFWQENFHISFTHMELRSKIAYVFFDETKMYFHSTSHKNSVVFFS